MTDNPEFSPSGVRIRQPDEQSGTVDGRPFTVKAGESIVVQTHRGRVRVTYSVSEDWLRGELKSETLDDSPGEDHVITDKLEPALSAEEWRQRERHFTVREFEGTVYFLTDAGGYNVEAFVSGVADLTATIALTNAALPDSERRKITREKIAHLRELVELANVDDAGPRGESWQSDELLSARTAVAEFADALASYLPPEGS